MPRPHAYHIRPVLAGRSLVEGLRQLLKDRTWTDVRHLVSTRRISINGNICTEAERRLRTGDVLHVLDHARSAPPAPEQVQIAFRDEHVLVCEKPAGVTSVRHEERRPQHQPTLDEMLQSILDAEHSGQPARRTTISADGIIRRAGGAPQIRPVHRLDRDTSGLMIFALSAEAENSLTAAFRDHAIERVYLAIVHGHPGERTIESLMIPDRGDGLRGSLPAGQQDESAQRAITHVRTAQRIGRYSVVECRLETGRTHQIRIHLAEIGHMICGERTYLRPAPGAPAVVDESGAPRQALHSAELRFSHPITGERLEFESPLPRDLSSWLTRLAGVGKPGQSAKRARRRPARG